MSDEKDLNEVYEDRNLLACALAQSTHAPSGWVPAPDTGDEWAVVFIETPMGQLSWHVPIEMARSLAPKPMGRYEYDGHSRDEKNDRLADWAASGCRS